MNEIVNTQTLLFLKAIEIGILLGMFYDLIRIFRKIIKHPNWLVQVEDVLYWGTCIAVSFGILYIHNFAEIRFFVFIGMVLGAIFYLCTFSILFMKIASWIIDLIQRFVLYIIRLVSIPIKGIIRLLKIPINFFGNQFNRLSKYRRYKAKKIKRAWYYFEADVKSGIRVKQNKNIYKRPKND